MQPEASISWLPPATGTSYLLSAHRQSDHVKHYRLWLVLYSLGFFAAGSVALWLFNARFG